MVVFAIALAAALFVAYRGCGPFPFVFDDLSSIPANPTLGSWIHALRPPTDTTVAGRPLVNLSFAFNYALGGIDPAGYRLGNVLILLASAATLLGLVRRLLARGAERWAGSATTLAGFAALLWALHPLQTESVTYVVQRAESLMGLCYLLVLYATVRMAETEPTAAFWGWTAVVCCWLGMAAKEVMVSAPVIALALDRTCFAGTWREALRRRGRWYGGMALSWALLFCLWQSTDSRSGTAGLAVHLSRVRFLRTQAWAVLHYLRLAICPSGQIFDYGSYWIDAPAQWLTAGVAVLVLAGIALIAFARGSRAGWLAGWFFAVLAPTCLVFGARQTLAEHRMYLALAPVIVLLVMAAFGVIGRWSYLLFAGAAAALTFATAARNRVYATELGLWLDTVAKVPGNNFAWNNVGHTYMSEGRWADAETALRRSIAAEPEYADAWTNLAMVQMNLGRWVESQRSLAKALEIDPANAGANNDSGYLLRLESRPEESLPYFERALARQPDFADARNNYANSLLELGRIPQAQAEYRRALATAPSDPQAHNGLGLALLRGGAPLEAREEFAAAQRLDPKLAGAYANDGEALFQLGRGPEADQAYQAAEQRDPASADLHYNHGNIDFKLGHLPDAAAEYREAIRLKPAFAPVHQNLAVVLYKLGDLSGAEAEFAETVRLDPSNAAVRVNYAAILLNRGRPAEALAQLQRVEQTAPNTPGLAANLAAARAATHAP